MHRRELLGAVGAVGAFGLAGCVGGRRDPDAGDPTATPAELRTDFAIESIECGNQEHAATVAFDDGTVTVTGTVWGNDGCYVAHLESARLEDDTLTVRVTAASEAGEDQACTQCIVEIDYRLRVEVPRRPAEVVVLHRGEPVRTATP